MFNRSGVILRSRRVAVIPTQVGRGAKEERPCATRGKAEELVNLSGLIWYPAGSDLGHYR